MPKPYAIAFLAPEELYTDQTPGMEFDTHGEAERHINSIVKRNHGTWIDLAWEQDPHNPQREKRLFLMYQTAPTFACIYHLEKEHATSTD